MKTHVSSSGIKGLALPVLDMVLYPTMYASRDIQRQAGITRTQLVRWSELGIVKAHEDNRGRGKQRVYDYPNLVEALICAELNEFSMETAFMKIIMDMWRQTLASAGGWTGGSQYLVISISENMPVRIDVLSNTEILKYYQHNDFISCFSGNHSTLTINLGYILNGKRPQ